MEDQIKAVRKAIASAYCNLNFEEFCQRIGRDESDKWAQEYWRDFQALKDAFSRFDDASLAKIISP